MIAKKGLYFARWPEEVPFPGLALSKKNETAKVAAKKQGIKEIGSVAARCLWAALQDPNRTPLLLEADSEGMLCIYAI